jgi:superfamily II RNA helicase
MPAIQEYKQILCGKPQKLVSKFKVSYSIVLNLLKNGKTTGFHEFVDKSMMKKELETSISMTRTSVFDLQSSYQKKTDGFDLMRTPLEVCKEYIEITSTITMYSLKKKKELERKIANFKDTYKWLLHDVERLQDYNAVKKKIDSESNELTYLENYSKIHIDKICRILLDDGFVIETEGVYQLTEWGQVASCINEIHPLIAAKMLERWNWFKEFSVTQIISIFSLFTDVNVPEDFKRLSTTEYTYKYISELIDDYAKRELKEGLFTGIDYENLCIYDLIVEMPGWAACDTEVACKYFIQTVITERGISIGDFTKAILKISVITKEFIGVCEMVGDLGVDLLYKLKTVDSLILKYVATSQSLYV